MIMRVLLSDFALLCKCSGNVGHVTISVIMVLMCGECSDPPASRLLQVKMNIIPYETCRRMRSGINNTVHICIGSVPTRDFGVCKVMYNVLFVCVLPKIQKLHPFETKRNYTKARYTRVRWRGARVHGRRF